jgi:hypothetical protein
MYKVQNGVALLPKLNILLILKTLSLYRMTPEDYRRRRRAFEENPDRRAKSGNTLSSICDKQFG